MKTQQQRIEATYDPWDKLIRASLGEFPDFTCAYYNGDYSISLHEAQRRKHDFILQSVNFQPGMRVIDIGSGWSPLLRAIKERGGSPVGITLSPAQAEHGRRHGLEAILGDWKEINTHEFGKFDAVVSVGAFEHFCNPDEYMEGKQDEIYQDYFRLVHELLPKGGRHYLQTMTWGRNAPEPTDISLLAPRDSPGYIAAQLRNFYVDSGWLPNGIEHIMKNAEKFQLVSANSGRLDYIQTLAEWAAHFRKPSLQKVIPLAELAILWGKSSTFRSQVRSIRYGAQKKAFEGEVFDHTRMVLERT